MPTHGMATRNTNRASVWSAKRDNDDSAHAVVHSPWYAARSSSTSLDRDYLRTQTHWIRDFLDPQVAREGPDALHSDDLLTIDELLRALLESGVSKHDILYSRVHLAVDVIAGLATRWPKKLVEKCDALRDIWADTFGKLHGTLLYEPGGRLHGISAPDDLDKEKLTMKWLKHPTARLSPSVARKVGHLGFEPGDWWINALYAHRDGIIDSGSSQARTVSDANAAYAIVMAGSDEESSPDGQTIRYRTRSNDPGRYRLTAASPESRHPIRVLRSHTLQSLWKPRAGLRYEGLYKVTGWSLKSDKKSNEINYIVNLKRLPNQVDFAAVLNRPWADELEDYREYKRLREIEHAKLQYKQPEPQILTSRPTSDGASDGTGSEDEQQSHERRLHDNSVATADQPSKPKSSMVPAERIMQLQSSHDQSRVDQESNKTIWSANWCNLQNEDQIELRPPFDERHAGGR